MTAWRKLFHTDDSYGWICGDDTKISHQKPIGSGGYGEVHEVSLRVMAIADPSFVDDFQAHQTGIFVLSPI
jgi:hypothetical protein